MTQGNFFTGTNAGGNGLEVTDGSTTNFDVNKIILGTGLSVTSSVGRTVTLQSTGGGGGGVTSISMGSTGLTPSTASTGVVTVAGTLNTANGGLGGDFSGNTGFLKFTGPGTAFTTLTVDASTEIAGTLPVNNGGTGSTTASGARTNLGLGTIATQDANAVAITGGSITNVPDVLPSIANSLTLTSGASQVLTDAESGFIIYCDASTSDITIDFDPAISTNVQFTIIQIGTGANINIVPSAGTVNGVASVALTIQYNAVTVVALNPNTFFAIGV